MSAPSFLPAAGRRHALAAGLVAAVVVAAPAWGQGATEREQGSTTAPPENDEPRARTSADEEIEELVGPRHEETLVVTASRTEESILDAPVSVTVVGEERIETTAAETVADLLRGVPGLNVTQTSARQFSIVSRSPTSALANSQLALVDGRSIYQDFFGLVLWEAIPVHLDEYSRVEVLRGPGSAVWGANAMTGVVNIRTKSPRELDGGLVSLAAGEIGTRVASVRWADAFERFSYKVSAAFLEQDPWERENTFNDGTPIPEENEFENEGSSTPKLDVRFDVDGDHETRWSYQGGWGGTSGIMHTGIGPFSILDDSFNAYVQAAWEAPRTEFRFYVNRLDGEAVNLLNRLEFLFETDTWVAEATHHRQLGQHQVVFGGNARLNRFDLSLAPGEDERQEVGSFVEGRFRLGETATVNVGVRADWFDTVGLTLSPRTSFIWRVRPYQTLRLAYNRAFRAPSLVNNYLDTAVPNLATLPNGNDFVFVTFAKGTEELIEESIEAIELSWMAVLGGRTLLSAAVYRNVTRDVVDFYPASYYSAEMPPSGLGPDDVPERELVHTFAYRNIGKVRDQGLEVGVETALSERSFLAVSYTYQEPSTVIEDDPQEPLNVNLAPRHQVSASLSVRGPRWSGSVSGTYVDDAFWADVLDERFWGWTDSHVILDGSLGYRWRDGELELRVAGTNLLNGAVKQHVFGDIVRRRLLAELRWRF